MRRRAMATAAPIASPHGGWLWLHFNLGDARGNAWLAGADLPEPARAFMLSADNFQQLHLADACVYGAFADLVRRLDRPSSSEIGFLRFVMAEHMLVSGRHHPLCAIESARQSIEHGRRLPSVAGLLELIVEHVAEGIEGAADKLSGELDEIEEALTFDVAADHRGRLGPVRRTAVRLHRQLLGMRMLFYRFDQNDLRLAPALRLAAAKLAQRLDGLDRDIVEIRDRAHLLQEEIGSRLAEQSNRQLNVLTVVTTLLLPPTLVTGVFGMNTKDLPLTDVDGGFYWAMGLIAASVALTFWLVRRLGIMGR